MKKKHNTKKRSRKNKYTKHKIRTKRNNKQTKKRNKSIKRKRSKKSKQRGGSRLTLVRSVQRILPNALAFFMPDRKNY